MQRKNMVADGARSGRLTHTMTETVVVRRRRDIFQFAGTQISDVDIFKKSTSIRYDIFANLYRYF